MKTRCRIENILCRMDLKQDIVFDEERGRLAGFEATDFLGAYLFSHPRLKVRMMVFPSGEVRINGAKSREDIESSFWVLKTKLKEIGVIIDLQKNVDIEIENVLATSNVHDYLPDVDINLERLALADNAVYDPKKSPAVFLSFFMKGRRATAMVFASGKVLIGDVGCEDDANLVMEKVIEAVRR